MDFQDVAFISSRSIFSTIFVRNCGEVMTSGPPYVL